MFIWKLTPIAPNDPNWWASEYSGVAVIRAPSEVRARQIASRAFKKATYQQLGDPLPVSPWDKDHLVRCHQFEESGHEEDGAESILEPKGYEHTTRVP